MLGDSWGAGSVLVDLGKLELDLGRPEGGLDRLRQAARAFQQLGAHKRGLARVLEALARAAALEGRARRATRLAGAAAALRELIGAPLTAAEQRQVAASLEPVQAMLSAAERSAVWIEGWSLPTEQAVQYALDPNTGPH
jgi:hypothetical protein